MNTKTNVPLVLAIDTSCDETSVAVVHGVTVLSNVVASQAQLHKQYGGVFPTVTKQAHKDNLPATLKAALQRAHVQLEEIGVIAVTQGPGLAPALEVGIEFAKDLAQTWRKPLVPVNHIEGHVLSPLALPRTALQEFRPSFPALALVISGGHSEFILVKAIGEYERLGWTIDDAAGECLDKVGRVLDLGYPAGAIIEEFAKKGDSQHFKFPLPMTTSGDFNLSFSGMKTHARNLLTNLETTSPLSKQDIYNFCASFQEAVFRAITYKLGKILDEHEVREIWLGGGVAANMTLRKKIRHLLKTKSLQISFRTPYTKKLCGDNAAMIGLVVTLRMKSFSPLTASLKFERQPRWKLDFKHE